MRKNERIAWIVVIVIVVGLVVLAVVAGVSARKVRLACESVGYEGYESILLSRTDYCSKTVVKREAIIVTVPLEQALQERETER